MNIPTGVPGCSTVPVKGFWLTTTAKWCAVIAATDAVENVVLDFAVVVAAPPTE